MKLMWVQFRDGWHTQGASSLDVWQVNILPVMWMRHCGWTQLCGKMLPGFVICMHFFFFFSELSCEHIVIHSTLNSPAYVALNAVKTVFKKTVFFF